MWKPYKIVDEIKITQMFSMFEQKKGKEFSFPGEMHDFWECMYVIDGNSCASGDGRVYHLGVNDMIFHKPNEMHKFYVESDEAHYFIFSFSAEGSLIPFFENKVFRLSIYQDEIIKNLIEYIREKNSKGKKIYDKKSLRLYEDDKISLQNVATRIEQLLFSLNEEISQTYSSDSYDAVVFKNAVKFMNVNIQKQLSIDELAQKCNISPTGLKNIFSKYAGLGIHKYFLNLKINHAVHLLKQGVSVTQISEILAYSSQGYFSHAFKRETGKNPSEYMVDLAGE